MKEIPYRIGGDMSKWDAMRERETIHDFPCPREGWAKGEPRLRCYPELEKCGQDGECPYEFVYRQYKALRAVVQAVLGGSTPQQQVLTLAVCLGLETDSVRRQRMHDQKDAWEGIA